jgi:transcriptional regulator with XRE-family HTH domain
VTPASGEASETLELLGARIRLLRTSRGLTLDALARSTGISVSMLSLVERGRTSASVGTLMALSSALSVSMSELFARGMPHYGQELIRAEEQPVVETLPGVLRRILRVDEARGVEIAINEYAPQTGSARTALHHTGFEYGFVLEGELVVQIDGVDHVLKPGDHIAYASTRSHRIFNQGGVAARAIWMNLSEQPASSPAI